MKNILNSRKVTYSQWFSFWYCGVVSITYLAISLKFINNWLLIKKSIYFKIKLMIRSTWDFLLYFIDWNIQYTYLYVTLPTWRRLEFIVFLAYFYSWIIFWIKFWLYLLTWNPWFLWIKSTTNCSFSHVDTFEKLWYCKNILLFKFWDGFAFLFPIKILILIHISSRLELSFWVFVS